MREDEEGVSLSRRNTPTLTMPEPRQVAVPGSSIAIAHLALTFMLVDLRFVATMVDMGAVVYRYS